VSSSKASIYLCTVQVLDPAGGGQGREGNGLDGREAGGHCADRKDVGGNSEGGQVDKNGQQVGWIRNFAIRNFEKFRTKNSFRISQNFQLFRDRLSRNKNGNC
jgi:hypothetical protein